MGGNNLGFRAWFYFRQGWSTYFAFMFAAINTLTVTYYLAIDNYPVLKNIFPSFEIYILIVTIIGVPLLIGVGYAHYKKTPAYRAETDVWMQSNPYWARLMVNTQFTLSLDLKLLELLTKISNNEKVSENELDEIKEICKKFEKHVTDRSLSNKMDQTYFYNTEKV
jgi:hypothetical protein